MHKFHRAWVIVVVAAAVASHAENKLEVSPLNSDYSDSERIMVQYTLELDKGESGITAELSLFDIDTGKTVTRKTKLNLPSGKSSGWAAWGGEPPYLSAPPADINEGPDDELADGGLSLDEANEKALVEEDIPNGYYIPQVVFRRADGSVLIEKKYSGDEVTLMKARGQVGRKLDRKAADAAIAAIMGWLEKIEAAHAKAVEAGADVSRPEMMLTALRVAAKSNRDWLNSKRYYVLYENEFFCNSKCPEILAEYERITRDPSSAKPAGFVKMPNVRLGIGDGCFTAEGKPIFLLGQCLFAIWPHFETMRDLHMNVIHIGEHIDTLFPDGETEEPTGELVLADGNPKVKIKDVLDKCLEYGIKVDLGLTARPPKWFFEKHPDAKLKGYSMAGFLPWDIEHPETRDWVRKYFAAIMPQVANHPALNCVWLANEPGIVNNGPITERIFRGEMANKYGDISNLNKTCGTTFESFDAIRLPLDDKTSGELATEFWRFNLNRLTEFFTFMRDEVRKYDKTVYTCYKLNNMQMGWFCPMCNVNQEDVSDLGELIGMDSGTFPFAKPYYDWLACLSPGKPVVNLEFKGGGRRTKLDSWKAALFGLAGVDAWCWHGNPRFSKNMSSIDSLYSFSEASAAIQRNYDVVRAFHKFPRSPFCVVYPDPVLPRARGYFNVHTPVVNGIKMAGYIADYATEKRVLGGRLEEVKYDFIVLPAARYLRDEVCEKLRKWHENGGRIIVFGDAPDKGPLGEARTLDWLKPVPGKIWFFPAPKNDIEALRMLETSAIPLLPPRPVVIENAENEHVEFCSIPWKNARGEPAFATWIWNERQFESVKLKAKFAYPVASAVDLTTDKPVDVANMEIKPWDVMLLLWTPERN